MEKKQFDIIIPVSYKDCGILKKTIRWVRKNIETQGVLYVITSESCFSDFPSSFRKEHHVELIDENKMLDSLTFGRVRSLLARHNKANMTGWYFQQFLKMGFALTQYAKGYYLIWDADTIPLQRLSFFDEDTILFNPKKEHHQPYFDTITRLTGITQFAAHSFISEHMMVCTQVMKELVAKLADEGKDWVENIIDHCDMSNIQAFSEFETYGNYCLTFHPELMKPRLLTTLRCGGRLFGRQVSDRELELLALDFDTASFERREYPPFPRSVVACLDRVATELKHRIKNI